MCQNDQWPLPETFFVQVLPRSLVHWHPKSQRYRRGFKAQTLSAICTSCSSHKRFQQLQAAVLGIVSTRNQVQRLSPGKQQCDTVATCHKPQNFPHGLQILTLHQDCKPELSFTYSPGKGPGLGCCVPQRD